MAGLPSTKAGAVLDFITNRTVASVYFCLLSADPGVDPIMSNLLEVTDAGYGRQVMSFLNPMAAPVTLPITTSNATQVIFGPFSAGLLDTAAYGAIVDAASGLTGTVRYVWTLDNTVNAAAGESVLLPISSTALGF